jgi:cytoskeletal protein RodZ
MHQEQSSSIKAHQQEQEMLKKTTHKALEKEVKRKGGIMWLLIGVLVIGLVALGLWWRFR